MAIKTRCWKIIVTIDYNYFSGIERIINCNHFAQKDDKDVAKERLKNLYLIK